MNVIYDIKKGERAAALEKLAAEKILVLDGAMGTMLCAKPLNDLLNLTEPEKVSAVHKAYLPYADIIETNTFNANAVSLADYSLQDKAYDINRRGAEIARKAAAEYETAHPGQLRFVAGSMGPTAKLLSMAAEFGPEVTMDIMAEAYYTQASGLIDGGADILLVETALDLLNVKAAVAGAIRAMEERDVYIPFSFSFTPDKGNRILSGVTLEAAVESVRHTNPFSVGFNCGAGAGQLLPLLAILDRFPVNISVYPNAGFPDECGCYTQTPEQMSAAFSDFLEKGGRVNIVGGCCGTTPGHIKAISEVAARFTPRIPVGNADDSLVLAGASRMPDSDFIVVGERCNVAGSRKFLRLISEGNYDEALSIARAQVGKGAGVVDVNMDAALLDSRKEMKAFLTRFAADPLLAQYPVMIDSSDPEVISEALKILPGRPVVNSISLKEGEESFLRRAKEFRQWGAAVVVMAFDEKGQATDRDRRVEICRRSISLLKGIGFTFRDIVFDPNILTVGTGLPEHDRYGVDLLDAISDITAEYPELVVSGGLSNLSFSFRGNDYVRNAIHAVFLRMAVKRGLRMAIVNPASPGASMDIPADLEEKITDLLLGKEGASDALVALVAEKYSDTEKEPVTATAAKELTLEDVLYKGLDCDIETLVRKVLESLGSASRIIDTVLLPAMGKIGDAFSRSELFLPQVVKSAGVMKRIMALLNPILAGELAAGDSAESPRDKKRIVLATVRGDVHDIGKNIVGVVLRCNGYEVTDLGVMVDPEVIINTALETHADAVAVSGLITPSLAEMAQLASMMQSGGMNIPLFVGGATTSDRHTDLKLKPLYPAGGVYHTGDAAALAVEIRKVLDAPEKQSAVFPCQSFEPENERAVLASPEEGCRTASFSVAELRPLVNFRAMLAAYGIRGKDTSAEVAAEVVRDAEKILDSLEARNYTVGAVWLDGTAVADGDTLTLRIGGNEYTFNPPRLDSGQHRSICDYYTAESPVSVFAVSAGRKISDEIADRQSHEGILTQLLLARLAEAATELLHRRITTGSDTAKPVGIRPAVGYPLLADHTLMFLFAGLLDIRRNIDAEVTVTGAINPSASTCGLIIPAKDAAY